jgi:hypothetical protein
MKVLKIITLDLRGSLSSVCLSVCLPACLPVCLSFCLSVCLSVCLSSVCLSSQSGLSPLLCESTHSSPCPQVMTLNSEPAGVQIKKAETPARYEPTVPAAITGRSHDTLSQIPGEREV